MVPFADFQQRKGACMHPAVEVMNKNVVGLRVSSQPQYEKQVRFPFLLGSMGGCILKPHAAFFQALSLLSAGVSEVLLNVLRCQLTY